MSVLIREARFGDLERLLALYAQLGQDDGRVLDFDAACEIFNRIGSYPDYRLYIAICGHEIVGVFALLMMDNLGHMGKPSAIIEDVVVDERWRNRGIGKRMVDFAMEKSREKGCYKLVLSSNQQRTDAHRFYEKLGFVRHGFSFAAFASETKGVPL